MITMTAMVACAGGALLFIWHRRRQEDTVRHILRLAAEIEGVAATVEADLARADDAPPFCALSQSCREARERAEDALDRGQDLRQQQGEALIMMLLLLHEDHRRIVDLRSEVDQALARRAKAAGTDRCRQVSFGRSKPSCWAVSSLLTRPSTFG